MQETEINLYQNQDSRYEATYSSNRDEKAGTTFFAASRKWLSDRREHISAPSVDRYEYLLNKYIMSEFGERDIADITLVQVLTYISDLADKEKRGDSAISGSIMESLQSITGSVIAFAKRAELDQHATRRKAASDKNSYKTLSGEEIKKLVLCAKFNRSVDMLGVMLSLFTGIGIGEICALSWNDFALDRREISISHTLYRIKNRDEGSTSRTVLAVMDVRRSAVRVVKYPIGLDPYVREFYQKGCVFLTGEKDRYIEQRTFSNHLESTFRKHGLEAVTIARVKKTYDAGLSDIRYLSDSFYAKSEGEKPQISVKVDERWLLKEMENDLSALRSILGISSADMGLMMGITSENYSAIEAGEAAMDWSVFMGLLFLFKYNSKTESVVDALGLYPKVLKEKISLEV